MVHQSKKTKMGFDFKEKTWTTVKIKVYFMYWSPDSAKHVRKSFRHSELWWQPVNMIAFTAGIPASQKSQPNKKIANNEAIKNTVIFLHFHVLAQHFLHSLHYS